MMLKRIAAAASGIAVTAVMLTAGAVSASPVPPLGCVAWVGNAHPQDYTTEHVYAGTYGNRAAQVTVTAHYRTVKTVKYTTVPKPGTVTYKISDATPGYRVDVQVVVRSGKQSASCATSFTPQAEPAPVVTVTKHLTFATPSLPDLYAHVTTTGQSGSAVLSETIYCAGILEAQGDLVPFYGRTATPLEYSVVATSPPRGCITDLTATVKGRNMGTVSLSVTGTL
jgi:hypothetical protein